MGQKKFGNKIPNQINGKFPLEKSLQPRENFYGDMRKGTNAVV